MVIDGLLCEQCGALVDGDEPGYPRTCTTCVKTAGLGRERCLIFDVVRSAVVGDFLNPNGRKNDCWIRLLSALFAIQLVSIFSRMVSCMPRS